MKKFFVVLLAVMAACVTLSVSAHARTNEGTFLTVPQGIQEKAYDFALSHKFLSAADVAAMRNTNCIQRTVDAFFSRGWSLSAAVDAVARCAVEADYYPNVESAKKQMKKIVETARWQESNWTLLYDLLGL